MNGARDGCAARGIEQVDVLFCKSGKTVDDGIHASDRERYGSGGHSRALNAMLLAPPYKSCHDTTPQASISSNTAKPTKSSPSFSIVPTQPKRIHTAIFHDRIGGQFLTCMADTFLWSVRRTKVKARRPPMRVC